jgi:hypothetical protein
MNEHRRRWVQQFAALLRISFAHPPVSANLPATDLRVCESEMHALEQAVLAAGSQRGNPLGPQSYLRSIMELMERTPGSPQQRQIWARALLGALGTQLSWMYLQLAACIRSPEGCEASALASTPDFEDYVAYVYGLGGQAPVADTQDDEPAQQEAQPADKPTPPLSPEMIALAEDARSTVRQLRAALGLPDPQTPQPQQGSSELSLMMQDIEESERLMLLMQQRGLKMPDVAGKADQTASAPPSGKPISVQVERILYDFGDTTTPMLGRVPLPVRQAIKQLQEPMEALAAVDASVLSQEDHPAHLFLDAVVQRSLQFDSEHADGFQHFFAPLQRMIDALCQVPQPTAKIYEQALLRLEPFWLQADQEIKNIEERKEQALAQLEVRKQLASRLAFELVSRRDAGDAPVPVKQFLMGPWAQVLARAQLHPQLPQDAQRYTNAVSGLLWSASTRRAGARHERLKQVMPRLEQTLREGMLSVDLPQPQIDAFIADLAKIHEAILQAEVSTGSADQSDDFDAALLS